jgi:hypothetical protein
VLYQLSYLGTVAPQSGRPRIIADSIERLRLRQAFQ